MNAWILQTANLCRERSMIHCFLRGNGRGFDCVSNREFSCTADFESEGVEGKRKRLEDWWKKSQCSRMGWTSTAVEGPVNVSGKSEELNRVFLMVWPLSCTYLPHAASCSCSVYQLVPLRLLEWAKIMCFCVAPLERKARVWPKLRADFSRDMENIISCF